MYPLFHLQINQNKNKLSSNSESKIILKYHHKQIKFLDVDLSKCYLIR